MARPYTPTRLSVRTARVNALLATSLDAAAITGLLEPIGFEVEPAPPDRPSDADVLAVTVPSFRPDVAREVDVIEEVARHYGYSHIVPTERRSPEVGRLTSKQAERRQVRRLVCALGAHEAWTTSLVDPVEQHRVIDEALSVRVANPMAREESVLRAHLLPGLLSALRYNVGRRSVSLRLFEVGRVFVLDGERPVEREHLAVAFADELDDARSAVNGWWFLAEGLGLARRSLRLGQPAPAGDPLTAGVHPSRSAVIEARAPLSTSAPAGVVGEVDPQVLDGFGLADRRVGWLLLDLDALLALPRRPLRGAAAEPPALERHRPRLQPLRRRPGGRPRGGARRRGRGVVRVGAPGRRVPRTWLARAVAQPCLPAALQRA